MQADQARTQEMFAKKGTARYEFEGKFDMQLKLAMDDLSAQENSPPPAFQNTEDAIGRLSEN
jgi:hypothetical protein